MLWLVASVCTHRLTSRNKGQHCWPQQCFVLLRAFARAFRITKKSNNDDDDMKKLTIAMMGIWINNNLYADSPFESVLFGLHGWSSFAVKLIVNIRLPVCFAKLTTRNSHVIYKRWQQSTRHFIWDIALDDIWFQLYPVCSQSLGASTCLWVNNKYMDFFLLQCASPFPALMSRNGRHQIEANIW